MQCQWLRCFWIRFYPSFMAICLIYCSSWELFLWNYFITRGSCSTQCFALCVQEMGQEYALPFQHSPWKVRTTQAGESTCGKGKLVCVGRRIGNGDLENFIWIKDPLCSHFLPFLNQNISAFVYMCMCKYRCIPTKHSLPSSLAVLCNIYVCSAQLSDKGAVWSYIGQDRHALKMNKSFQSQQ